MPTTLVLRRAPHIPPRQRPSTTRHIKRNNDRKASAAGGYIKAPRISLPQQNSRCALASQDSNSKASAESFPSSKLQRTTTEHLRGRVHSSILAVSNKQSNLNPSRIAVSFSTGVYSSTDYSQAHSYCTWSFAQGVCASMESNRKPCLTQSTSWQSATTHLLSPTSYQFPLLKQEKSDSHAIQVSARPDQHPPISNELVPYQAEQSRDPTLMLFPYLKQENPGSNALQVSARSDPHLPISNELVPFQEVHSRDASSLEYVPCNDVYNPGGNYFEDPDYASVSDPIVVQESPFNDLSMPRDSSRRVLPSVGAFTVQCARCFKWRLIPTKEQYEAIRQCILEDPWVCENAYPWRPDASCDDPADISQDKSRLWAIDKPNISQPPPGWERLLVIRGEGASKFADVYYVTPSGKKLRSMVEVERFLIENPEYLEAGVNLSQFSYQIPKPLYEGYVRKRSTTTTSGADMGPTKKMKAIADVERNQKTTQAKPLSWRKPDSSSNLGMNSSVFGNDYHEGSNYNQSVQPELWRPLFPPFAKKKRSSRMKLGRYET